MKGYLLLGLLVFFGGMALKVMHSDHAAQRENAGNVTAQTLLAVAGIVQSHVGAGGTLPEGVAPADSIPLPSWFRSNLDNVLLVSEGDRAFVVAQLQTPAEALRVRSSAEKVTQAWVGIAQGGQLLRPGEQGPVPALPVGVPEGAVVVPIRL